MALDGQALWDRVSKACPALSTNGSNWLSLSGANVLKKRIQDFWAEFGVEVDVQVVKDKNNDVYYVRSNMIGAMPRSHFGVK